MSTNTTKKLKVACIPFETYYETTVTDTAEITIQALDVFSSIFNDLAYGKIIPPYQDPIDGCKYDFTMSLYFEKNQNPSQDKIDNLESLVSIKKNERDLLTRMQATNNRISNKIFDLNQDTKDILLEFYEPWRQDKIKKDPKQWGKLIRQEITSVNNYNTMGMPSIYTGGSNRVYVVVSKIPLTSICRLLYGDTMLTSYIGEDNKVKTKAKSCDYRISPVSINLKNGPKVDKYGMICIDLKVMKIDPMISQELFIKNSTPQQQVNIVGYPVNHSK